MVREPDPALLISIVEPELRKCSDLALEFQIFDRAAPGSHEGTLQYLYDAGRALCARRRRQRNLEAMKRDPKKVNPAAKSQAKWLTGAKAAPKGAPPKKPGAEGKGGAKKQIACTHFRNGTCKFGQDCQFVHFKNKIHTPTAAWPAGIRIDLGAQPGDDCKHATNPKECPFGNKCIYKHGDGDERSRKIVS